MEDFGDAVGDADAVGGDSGAQDPDGFCVAQPPAGGVADCALWGVAGVAGDADGAVGDPAAQDPDGFCVAQPSAGDAAGAVVDSGVQDPEGF